MRDWVACLSQVLHPRGPILNPIFNFILFGYSIVLQGKFFFLFIFFFHTPGLGPVIKGLQAEES